MTKPQPKNWRDRVFWTRMVVIPGGCWEWTGNRVRDGYGRIMRDGQIIMAHRHAWTLVNGVIPHGMDICHTCDNPPCCNPDHLFVGTRADNLADMVAKGRQSRGRDRWNTRLTENDVRDIRIEWAKSRHSTLREVAGHYDVSITAIFQAVTRKTWKHLP